MFEVPQKIKRQTFISNLTAAIVGGVITFGLLFFRLFALDKIQADPSILTMFSYMIWAAIAFSFIAIFLPALFFLIFKPSFKQIEKTMKKHNVDSESLLRDYEQAERSGGIRFGKWATYIKKNGRLYVVPNTSVLWVYKRISGNKQKRVNLSRDGDILNERYLMGEHYRHYVVIRTDDGKAYTVRCTGHIMADGIIQFYLNCGGVILGNDTKSRKEYYKVMKERKQK